MCEGGECEGGEQACVLSGLYCVCEYMYNYAVVFVGVKINTYKFEESC